MAYEVEVYRKFMRKYEESRDKEQRDGELVEMDTSEAAGDDTTNGPGVESTRKRPAEADAPLSSASCYHSSNITKDLLLKDALLLPWQAKIDWYTTPHTNTNNIEDTTSTTAKRLRIVE